MPIPDSEADIVLERSEVDRFYEIVRAAQRDRQAYRSVEDLNLKLEQECPKARAAMRSIAAESEDEYNRLFWMSVVASLAAHSHWEKLQSEPGKFNAELDRLLDSVRVIMRTVYRVKDALPARKEKRDREIWEAKQTNPRQSFGVIGTKRKLTRQAARESYQRQVIREQKRLASYVDSLLALVEVRKLLLSFRTIELRSPDVAAMGLAVARLPKISPPVPSEDR